MSRKRIEQLSVAYANMMDISTFDARKIIISTPTGKAIANGSKSVLYEHHTANLYCIADELGMIGRGEVSPEMIVASVATIADAPAVVKYKFAAATPSQKRESHQKLVRVRQKQIRKMRIASKNLLNVGRAMDVNQCPRQKG